MCSQTIWISLQRILLTQNIYTPLLNCKTTIIFFVCSLALLSMHKTFSPLCISICLLQHYPTSAFVIPHTHNFTCLSNDMWLVWEFRTTFDWPIFWQYHQFINLKCANNTWCSSKLKVIVGLGLSWLQKGIVADQSLNHWA